jgi:hypothetical protein
MQTGTYQAEVGAETLDYSLFSPGISLFCVCNVCTSTVCPRVLYHPRWQSIYGLTVFAVSWKRAGFEPGLVYCNQESYH